MTVIDLNSNQSESSWIDHVTPEHGDGSVGCIDDFVVAFTRTISASSLNQDSFKLLDNLGEEVSNAFRPIVLSNDYNEISRTLTLKLSAGLSPDSQYTFIVDGLYSPSGESQDNPHAVTFVTDEFTVSIPEVQEVQDVIEVSDHSLLDAPLVVSNTATARVITTIPTKGAYNLSSSYNTGMITVTMSQSVESPQILVERRAISVVEGQWDIVAPESVVVDQVDGRIIQIQLAEVTTGVYFEDGYEYKASLLPTTLLEGDVELGQQIDALSFTGPLPKMYTTIASVLMQYPSASSYDVAKLIYISSSYAYTVDSEIVDTAPTKAATDYALYSTLWQLSTRGGDQKMIQLADLIVEKSEKNNMQEQWRRLAEDALSRIGGVGPEVTIKGGSHTSPFATRNW